MIVLDELKQRVHQLANHMQSILGYIELNEFEKARHMVVEAVKELRQLSLSLGGTVVVPIKDSPAVLPHSISLADPDTLTAEEKKRLHDLGITEPIIVIPLKKPKLPSE